MSTTLTEGAAAPVSDRARATDWPFLGAAVAMTAVLIALVDARPATFFLGRDKAPQVALYGHIAQAINLDHASFYDPATNRLRPAADLARIAAQVPAGPAITYCNTGHWAATDWFVLSEILGRKNTRVYDGSMAAWTADTSRPVVSSRTKWDDLKKALGLGT